MMTSQRYKKAANFPAAFFCLFFQNSVLLNAVYPQIANYSESAKKTMI